MDPDPSLEFAACFLHQLTDQTPDPAAARALDAYFIVGAEHGFNASTFTARVIISTQSDLASAVVGAIGALKGLAARRRAVRGSGPAASDGVGR